MVSDEWIKHIKYVEWTSQQQSGITCAIKTVHVVEMSIAWCVVELSIAWWTRW